jgi:subtilisin family serine protease
MTVNGTLHPTSAHGLNLFVTAPGTNILSTVPGNKVQKMSGTSMACPHVAGLVALILERNPSLTAKKVREIIAKNTKKVGNIPYSTNKTYGTWNEHYGYGLIDAYKAVLNTPRN